MREDVPHHYLIFIQQPDLTALDATVRRAEKLAISLWPLAVFTETLGLEFHFGVALADVIHVFVFFGFPAAEMMKGMIAHGVTLFDNFSEHIRVFVHIVADAKESSLRAGLF